MAYRRHNNTTTHEIDFTRVNNDLLRYGARAFGNAQSVLFLVVLMMYDHGKTGVPVYPSQNRLADYMQLSTKQVGRLAKALASKGVITINTHFDNDRRRNFYVIHHAALKDLLARTRDGVTPGDDVVFAAPPDTDVLDDGHECPDGRR